MNDSSSNVQAVVLIGFMGCGKSSVAHELAQLTKLPVVDLDASIVQRVEKSIAQVFADEGEAAFRALESQVLEENIRHGGIIATGGGVVTQATNRELLKSSPAHVVYLRATPPVLAERIRREPGVRPLIDGERELDLPETEARVQQLLQMRAPWYEECATLAVDSDTLTTAEVAEQIADFVKSHEKTPVRNEA